MNDDVAPRTWWMGCLAVLLVAAALRFSALTLMPFHQGEAVNGIRLVDLVRDDFWHYDKDNFNGPMLAYLSLPVVREWGLSDASLRLVPAMFGVFTVLLVLLLHRPLGRRGALWAAWWFALSPGACYLAREYLHESLFVCFTLATIVPFYYRDRLGWLGLAACVSGAAVLLFATKEMASLVVGALIVGEFVADIVCRKHDPRPDPPWPDVGTAVVAGLSLFVIVYVMVYSSFFTYSHGVVDAMGTQPVWSHGGRVDWDRPFWQYGAWLATLEPLLLLMALFGVVLVLTSRRCRTRLNVMLVVWLGVEMGCYSYMVYKAPWQCLDLILPMALLAGVASGELSRRLDGLRFQAVHGVVSACMLAQAIQLCFFKFDSPAIAYTANPTSRNVAGLLEDMRQCQQLLGVGQSLRIGCFAEVTEYWPLPWYFRDYPQAHFWVAPAMSAGSNPDIIISRSDADPNLDQTASLQSLVSDVFHPIDRVELRPGVTLEIWCRKPGYGTE